MKALALALAFVGCTPQNWRTRDSLTEATLFAVTMYDWNQTVSITRNCSESNPIIGPCGERVNMHAYFASTLVLEVIVSRILDNTWRPLFQGAWIGAETATVIDNELP